MRILLVEPWLHGSHQLWAEGYRAASRHEVRVVGLAGGRWRWLLRAGALELAALVEREVAEHGQPDLLLVSGTVDVAHLLGLGRRVLDPGLPVAVYQHESQLVYPGRRAGDDEPALRNWLSWCAADLVLFNSDHHREVVTAALPAFLERTPKPSHLPYLDDVIGRFEVLPVGVDLDLFRSPAERPDGGAPIVLWPHRWEPDKDPDAFGRALGRLEQAGLGVRVVLAGEDPPGGSHHVRRLRLSLADQHRDQVVAVGPFERDEYIEWVKAADIVVSCAHHEFFGVAVVEAMAAGCRPVLPDALAYPEVVPPPWHDVALYPPGRFGTALLAAVGEVSDGRRRSAGLAAAMDRFATTAVAARYDDRFEALR